jgi:hypothetical protein
MTEQGKRVDKATPLCQSQGGCKQEATEQCGVCSRWFCAHHINTQRLHEPYGGSDEAESEEAQAQQ